MASLIFKNVTKIYDNKSYGLIDFDCEIKNGEFVSVIGPSGSGKTTFLKLIAGLLSPQCGEMYIDNELVNNIPPQKRNVAMMFQEYVLYPNYNVYDNVAAYLKFNKVDPEVIARTVYNALELFNVKELANRRIKELSGGQKQRVALAKIFVRTPGILLLDEPLSNVDESKRREYRTSIRMLKDALPNTTFIYVTHNVNEALSLSDRILVIEDGRNVSFTKPINIVNYPPTLGIAQLLKSEQLEFVEHTFSKDDFYYKSIDKEIDLVIKHNEHYLAYDNNDRLIGGGKDFLIKKATLTNGILKMSGLNIVLPLSMKNRLLANNIDVFVCFDLSKINQNKNPNDIEIELRHLQTNGEYHLVDFLHQTYMVNLDGELLNTKLYINVNDISIYDSFGSKVLANYTIYPNQINVDSKKDTIKICGSKINISHNGIIEIPRDAITLCNKRDKESIKLNSIISEEIISKDKKLIYAVVDGFEHYICFYVSRRQIIKYNDKNYIKFIKEKILFK